MQKLDLDPFLVYGGLSGYSDTTADETKHTEKFSERFATLDVAVVRARQLAARLQPGGMVSVIDESLFQPGLMTSVADIRVVGIVRRHPEGPWDCSGQWWSDPDGIDLRQ